MTLNIKDIRKIIKEQSLHNIPTNQIGGTWTPLDKDWTNHTFTNKLFLHTTQYDSLFELLSNLTRTNPQELVVSIRREITKYIKDLSSENFETLLIAFRKNNPQYKTKTKQGLCKVIKETNEDFDDCLLPFVSRILNLDFILFITNNELELVNKTNSHHIQDSVCLISKQSITNPKTTRWNLVGFLYGPNTLYKSIFSRKSMHKTIDNFVDKHNYILGLIKITFQMHDTDSKISLNIITLYEKLKLAMGIEYFTRDTSCLINKITAVFLDNLEYKINKVKTITKTPPSLPDSDN
jgi:hypothetical protein